MDFPGWQELAEASSRIYVTASKDVHRAAFPGSVRAKVLRDPRFLVRYVWIEDKDRHVICFRGSVTRHRGRRTPRSWDLNFRIGQKRIPLGPNAHVHAGYLHQSTIAFRRLRSALRGNKQVVLTGHSQGGALALCLGVQFHRFDRTREVTVVTFGQPRVGSRGLARYLDLHRPVDVTRVVNRGDFVANVPLAILNYDHCERPVYLLGGTDYAEQGYGRPGRWGSLRAHDIDQYVRRLGRLSGAP